jgi:hypothetical protein
MFWLVCVSRVAAGSSFASCGLITAGVAQWLVLAPVGDSWHQLATVGTSWRQLVFDKVWCGSSHSVCQGLVVPSGVCSTGICAFLCPCALLQETQALPCAGLASCSLQDLYFSSALVIVPKPAHYCCVKCAWQPHVQHSSLCMTALVGCQGAL